MADVQTSLLVVWWLLTRSTLGASDRTSRKASFPAFLTIRPLFSGPAATRRSAATPVMYCTLLLAMADSGEPSSDQTPLWQFAQSLIRTTYNADLEDHQTGERV